MTTPSNPPYHGDPAAWQRPTQPPPQPPTSGRNTLGLISVIVGAIPMLFSLVSPLIYLVAYRVSYGLADAVTLVLGVATLAVGATALVLGIVALRRRGLSKLLPGIGIGLGAAAVWGSLSSALYPFVMQFAY